MKHSGLITFFISAALALSTILTGCTPPAYVAPAVNAPIFTGAGQVRLAGHLGFNGIDGQAAVAATDDFAVLASGSYQNEGEELESHAYGEVAGGLYGPVGPWGNYGIFAGLGYGRSSGDNAGTEIDEEETQILASRGTYSRPFLQFQFGALSKYAEVAYVTRLAYVMYEYNEINRQTYYTQRSALFIEPAIVGRVGSENVKLEAQLAYIGKLGEESPEGYLEHEEIHLSLGLHVLFGGPDRKLRQ